MCVEWVCEGGVCGEGGCVVSGGVRVVCVVSEGVCVVCGM